MLSYRRADHSRNNRVIVSHGGSVTPLLGRVWRPKVIGIELYGKRRSAVVEYFERAVQLFGQIVNKL